MSRLTQRAEAASRSETIASVLTFSALLFLPALVCFFRDVVDDPDVWWHLKAGQWILQRGAWPTVDTFSFHGAGNPWTAYSWIAELLLYGLHQAFGLRGLVLYTAGLSVAIVAAFHGLVWRLTENSLWAVVLTLAAALGMICLETPRPWLFSILLFVIELDLLLTAGRTGNRRLLLWLVPLFAFWANVHIQFVLGLVVLGMAVAEPLLVRMPWVRLVDDGSSTVSFRWMLLIFGLCLAATLANPYHYHLYEVAAQLVGQANLWSLIQELGAMRFQSVDNWIVLAATVGAAFAVGRKGRVRLLLLLLLAMAVYFSFRSRRDAWIVLFVGLTVLAYTAPKAMLPQRFPVPGRWRWAVAGLVAAGVVVGSLALSESTLEEKIAAEYPARAVEFVARQRCSGPMFNPFEWGGYLIFNLPNVPVSIDGRTMVHGEERLLRHADTLRGREGWQVDPELARARLVVVRRAGALAQLVRLDDRFHLIYEDSVAVVFTSKTNHPTRPPVATKGSRVQGSGFRTSG